jgi:hypothetical protein
MGVRLYAGKHVGPEPPKMLCMSQASLLDGVLPMFVYFPFIAAVFLSTPDSVQGIDGRTSPHVPGTLAPY